MTDEIAKRELRRGWTTGACATAAARAAYQALLGEGFPDPVGIVLPSGAEVRFSLAAHALADGAARAGVVKDAGDDPDVTHGALVTAELRRLPAGSGIRFAAGAGVGTITRPGLPLPPGEPAINPVPRAMIEANLRALQPRPDLLVTIGVEDGEALAARTLNPRLGIVGGLSILGTTGIVIPFSCAAWIDSIHRGIDVARASGLAHIAASTGRSSEQAVQALYGLDEAALIEMGDFAGGVLKYLRTHPVPRLSLAGGIGKVTKLAQGRLDLHSKRGSVGLPLLARWAAEAGLSEAGQRAILTANTAAEALKVAQGEGVALADLVATHARETAEGVLDASGVALEVLVFDPQGTLLGRSAPSSVRKRRT